jgi:hypothetical protein
MQVGIDSVEINRIKALIESKERFIERAFSLEEQKEFSKRNNKPQHIAAAFSAKPMYLMNSKNKHYLFERLENHGTSEDKAVWDHIDCGDYSIEHIMPQHLTSAWVEVLGENYESIFV